MKYRLAEIEKCILFLDLIRRSSILMNNLENELPFLEVADYFDKYYDRLYMLITMMERFYPDTNMSLNYREKLRRINHFKTNK